MALLTQEMWDALDPNLRRRLANSVLPPIDTTATEKGQKAPAEVERDETERHTEPEEE